LSKNKKSIENILNDLDSDKSFEGVTSSAETKEKISLTRKKKNWRKRIILTFVGLFLIAGVALGFKAYDLMQKIFQGSPVPGLLGFLSQGELKGESSGRVNVLLLGMGGGNHPGGDLADTIMVASVNTKTNEVAMISVPRDLYVPIGDYGSNKINAAYSYGEQNKDKEKGGGPELMKKVISENLGIPIHYYVRIDFSGFSKVVDTIGGVDINVEDNLYDPFYPGGLFSMDKGQKHMDGDVALKYARSRETTSDFDRAKRQQQVIVSAKERILSADTLLNPKKMNEMMDILGDHVRTDFQIWELERLAKISEKVDKSKIINRVLDNGPDGPLVSSNISGMYVLLPKTGNFDEIKAIVKNIFIDSYIRKEAATIEVLNASGSGGLAQRVADQLSSFGYKVENIATSDKILSKTEIYDYSNGAKPRTTEYLEKRFCASVLKKEKGTNGYDITILVGKDQADKY